jgi:hypothetical protein
VSEGRKSELAKSEAERAEHQNVLGDIMQEKASKAIRDQMTLLTAQMTECFVSLVSALDQLPGVTPKRTVQAHGSGI